MSLRTLSLWGLVACSACRGGAPGTDVGKESPPNDAGDTSHDGAAGDTPDAGASASGDAAANGASGDAQSTNAGNADGASATCGAFAHDYTSGNGSVTFYTIATGSPAVACSFAVKGTNPDVVAWVSTGGGQYFGAMNTADFDTAAACGACVEVTRTDTQKKVDITIVDECPTDTNPKCTAGHIDLSEAAFLQIGTANEGYLGTGNGAAVGTISWKYIPCPTTSDVSFALKEPTNVYWNQILVEGHRYPVAKVEVMVGKSWNAATRQSYNYWQVGNGDMGAAPYQVRATDINGSQIEASLALASGDLPSASQFPLCH